MFLLFLAVFCRLLGLSVGSRLAEIVEIVEIVEIRGRYDGRVSLLLDAFSKNSIGEDPWREELRELGVEIILLSIDVVAEIVVLAELGGLHGSHEFVRVALRIVGNRVLDDFAAVFEALEDVLEEIVKAVFPGTGRGV